MSLKLWVVAELDLELVVRPTGLVVVLYFLLVLMVSVEC